MAKKTKNSSKKETEREREKKRNKPTTLTHLSPQLSGKHTTVITLEHILPSTSTTSLLNNLPPLANHPAKLLVCPSHQAYFRPMTRGKVVVSTINKVRKPILHLVLP